MKLRTIVGGFPLPLSTLLWIAVFTAAFLLYVMVGILTHPTGFGLAASLANPRIWRILLMNMAWSSALAIPMGVQVATMCSSSLRSGSIAARMRPALILAAVATLATFAIVVAVIPRANTRVAELRYELNGQPLPADRYRSDRELTLSELWKRTHRLKPGAVHSPLQPGRDTTRRALLVELAKKFTIPLLCPLVAFAAAIIGTILASAGRSRVPLLVLLNCALFFLSWALLVAGEHYGDSGVLPPVVAALLAHVALAAVGTALLGRARSSLESDTRQKQP